MNNQIDEINFCLIHVGTEANGQCLYVDFSQEFITSQVCNKLMQRFHGNRGLIICRGCWPMCNFKQQK